ncbi:gamma-glutamyltransferase family protein [Dinghuibacter silviterrae]|uniref:Gamma-glutamyltranspeptidase/glutathione hydrolase n=1 Tax=Dinghuibacter silviterrae TaxID=1539049 RepID=A0A4R8DNG1_9BACT|nr:gamma-glutamyltransferase [Dinghuibacter silviterrae]TDW99237.1 gamma-glutamyltranspeptidase/glutathione hydrolase [Dinghuibacter silviterrae]
MLHLTLRHRGAPRHLPQAAHRRLPAAALLPLAAALLFAAPAAAQQTQKPPLHGTHWMAVTGKPLAAEAGAQIFQQGGNAIDAACAMLAAVCTMWDVLSWGGETQALIYNPKTGKVIAINALGFAPTGATPAFFKSKGYDFPPEYGPLAAVTPGTPGGLCYMLAEYGTLSLQQVLAPAMEMAGGYAIEAETADSFERQKARLKQWPYSKAIFLTHPGERREAPEAGEVFVQKDLLATLTKMVEAEQDALRHHKSRKEAIYAAYDRFYKGDIAREFVRGCQEQGGLITMEDLAAWKPLEEEPLHTNYRGVEVYKLQQWTQGPTMLQTLNILENFNLKDMGYNSARYIHTIYQAMNLAFADRDFYYGDPYTNTGQPMQGLLSKAYAKDRAATIDKDHNNASAAPGDPYPYEGRTNPFNSLLQQRAHLDFSHALALDESLYHDRLWRGTTSIEAADKDGWVISVTPSGGWPPACVAGHTGVGMSQRMQSFVLDSVLDPFNVVAPRKRPRVTLTPSLALRDNKPFLCFSVQGGDTQDQNLLQFFLDMVEFGMTVQEATEAPNINSDQLWLSLGGEHIEDRRPRPGRVLIGNITPPYVREELRKMGYTLTSGDRTSGPINAIFIDARHGTLWGGSSNNGEDYGIGW